MLSLVENLFLQKHPLQDLLSSLNAVISTNESTRFISDHVIYNLAYTFYEMSTRSNRMQQFQQMRGAGHGIFWSLL